MTLIEAMPETFPALSIALAVSVCDFFESLVVFQTNPNAARVSVATSLPST
jgi:hypothetical protein